MVLSDPLADLYTQNCSETPNCHQNLDIIAVKHLQGVNSMGLCACFSNSKTKNCSETPNFHQNLEMIALKPLTKLIITSLMTQLAPTPLPSINLQGEQICMYGFYTAHRKLVITSGYKYQDQLIIIQ